jgi:phosphoglycerate kinase
LDVFVAGPILGAGNMPFIEMSDLDLASKQLLIRVDLNVPIENGKVTSFKRIEAILPTIHMGFDQGARILLVSHLGRPKEGEFDPEFSLAPVAKCLSELLNMPVRFIKDLPDQLVLNKGEVALFENVRFLKGEKENSSVLGKRLAGLCDIFVMDAFATAHRKEASTYSVAQEAKIACAGPLLVAEVGALDNIMAKSRRPLVAIVGGSKVSTKLLALQHLITRADSLIVGGGIANTFLAASGYPIGKSLYEPELVPEAKAMLLYAEENNKKIPLPEDVIVAKEYSKEAEPITKQVGDINDEMILDIGPKTLVTLSSLLINAKTILWNGPVGVFEWDQFGEGTKALAEAVARSDAYSVAGGGDTIAAIEKYHVQDEISYISTGGGAFLEYLEGKSLPALEILARREL